MSDAPDKEAIPTTPESQTIKDLRDFLKSPAARSVTIEAEAKLFKFAERNAFRFEAVNSIHGYPMREFIVFSQAEADAASKIIKKFNAPRE